MPLRVLHCINTLAPYGAETLLATLAAYRDPAALDMRVAVLRPPLDLQPALEAAGVPVTVLGGRGGLTDLRAARAVARLCRAVSPDLVHTHLTANYWGRLGALAAGLPVVVHEHAMLVTKSKGERRADWVLALGTRGILTVSRSVAESLRVPVRRGFPRVATLPNCLRRQFLEGDTGRRAEVRSAWGAGDGDFVVGVVGRLHPEKGPDVAVRALAHLRGRHPEARLVFLGDGPQRSDLERLVVELGLRDHVVFAGRREDVRACLEAMDALLVPSRREAFGMAIIEAMAAGVAVAAADVAGPREIVEDGATGLLFPPERPEAMAEALGRLAADRGLRAGLAASARSLVTTRYHPRLFVERLMEFYASLGALRAGR